MLHFANLVGVTIPESDELFPRADTGKRLFGELVTKLNLLEYFPPLIKCGQAAKLQILRLSKCAGGLHDARGETTKIGIIRVRACFTLRCAAPIPEENVALQADAGALEHPRNNSAPRGQRSKRLHSIPRSHSRAGKCCTAV